MPALLPFGPPGSDARGVVRRAVAICNQPVEPLPAETPKPRWARNATRKSPDGFAPEVGAARSLPRKRPNNRWAVDGY